MSVVKEPSQGVDPIQESAQRRSTAPWLSVVVAILVATLVGLGIWWVAGGGSDSESTAPGTVFSWDGDDLSAWVTEDEMTAAFEHVSTRYADADLDGQAVLEHAVSDQGATDDWVWRVGPADDVNTWTVFVHNGDHDGRYVGPPTETDPRLPQGATYEQDEGFAWMSYIVSGPNSDESICITLQVAGWSDRMWLGLPRPYTAEVEAHEDMVFALASTMLQEMGWVT